MDRSEIENRHNEIVATYRAGDRQVALKRFTELAELEHADSQQWLGFMYGNGFGVDEDQEKANYWWSKAAANFRPMVEKGNAEAMYQLGLLYEEGQGVDQDIEYAVQLFRDAHASGHASATHHLACLYSLGEGVEQSDSTAHELTRAAAELGSVEALFSLGLDHLNGTEVCEKSVAKAEHFLLRAAALGDAENQHEVAQMYFFGVFRGQPEPVNAFRWFEASSYKGNIDSTYMLGRLHLKGLGTNENVDKGIELLTAAAEQGHCTAQLTLGDLYASGFELGRDDEKAAYWYRRSGHDEKNEALPMHCFMYSMYPYSDREVTLGEMNRILLTSIETEPQSLQIEEGIQHIEKLARVKQSIQIDARELAVKWWDEILGQEARQI